MTQRFSAYDNQDHIARSVADGRHREVIGGLWEELGALQHDFLLAQGMKPADKVIDIGCGSLRAGLPLARYLDAGCYYGVDLSPELLEAGYQREIIPAGLDARLPRENLHATGEFDLSGFGVQFDLGIAQSVFTHMPIHRLTDCLSAVAPHFRAGGRYYVTYFERPDEVDDTTPVPHLPGGVLTHFDRDPYDNRLAGLEAANTDAWDLTVIGDWDHPRDQRMALFTRKAD